MGKNQIPAAVSMSGFLLSLLFAGGCGRGSSGGVTSTDEAKHIQRIPGLISQYEQAAKKRPAKIEEVRDWAVKEGKAEADDFVSTRDKEPYGITFTATGVVVYEKTGKNGKCYIFRMGGASEVPAEDVKRTAEEQELGPGGTPKKKK